MKHTTEIPPKAKLLLVDEKEDLERKMQSLQVEIIKHQQVKETLLRSRSVLEPAPDPVVVYDVAGIIAYTNPADFRMVLS